MGNHIDHIEITNFKSIRHQKIEGCKRINVFIGYPNVGKSNILEAIGLFSTLLLDTQEHFSFDGICRVEETGDIFYNNDYKKGAQITVNSIAQLNVTNTSPSTLELMYSNVKDVGVDEAKAKFNKLEKLTVNFPTRLEVIDGAEIGIHLNYEPDSFKVIPFPIKKYEFKKNYVGGGWRDGFSLGIPNGHNLIDILRREPELTKEINDIFKKYDLRIIFNDKRDRVELLKDLPSGAGSFIPYSLVADTLQRLIFYMAAIASNKNAVLLFEEPEAHMFPPYVSKLSGDIIFDKENGNQYFINTHSPFVIGGFLEDAREDLSVYLVDYKNSETVIKKLSDDELHEVYQYGVDLFFNIQSYLD